MKNLLLMTCIITGLATGSLFCMEEDKGPEKQSQLQKKDSRDSFDTSLIIDFSEGSETTGDPENRSLLSNLKKINPFKKEDTTEKTDEIKQVVKLKEKKVNNPWNILEKADAQDIQIITVEGDVTRNYNWGDGQKKELQKKLLNIYSSVSLNKDKRNVNIDLKTMGYEKPATLKDKLLDTSTLAACGGTCLLTLLLTYHFGSA